MIEESSHFICYLAVVATGEKRSTLFQDLHMEVPQDTRAPSMRENSSLPLARSVLCARSKIHGLIEASGCVPSLAMHLQTQSATNPEAFTTGAHNSRSARCMAANSCGLVPVGWSPNTCSFCLISGSASPATGALFKRSILASGVF